MIGVWLQLIGVTLLPWALVLISDYLNRRG